MALTTEIEITSQQAQNRDRRRDIITMMVCIRVVVMELKLGITGFARVDAVIASVLLTPDWPKATKPSDCYLYQLSSAMNLNIFEPFTDEQEALNVYLTQRQAGKRLCDYAWRLYAQSVT